MGNYYTPFPLRVSEELMDKVKVIAAYNKHSANKEIEAVLLRYVREWEQRNGPICFPGDE